ncbi:unnamed protein product [Brachionus calyciflorus]|uniref:Uncharacterized protein n=1 Tax=Brachionus calyciflorus TaxID=104777 RepID=A0A813LXM6_9BILA|nr:unnamed protein product [Brachionus calyciflorus]
MMERFFFRSYIWRSVFGFNSKFKFLEELEKLEPGKSLMSYNFKLKNKNRMHTVCIEKYEDNVLTCYGFDPITSDMLPFVNFDLNQQRVEADKKIKMYQLCKVISISISQYF